MAILGLFKKTAEFRSVRQISLIALATLRFPDMKSALPSQRLDKPYAVNPIINIYIGIGVNIVGSNR